MTSPMTLTLEPTASAPALTLRPWQDTDIPVIVAAHRVAHKCGCVLESVLAPMPPKFPSEGHRHLRTRPRLVPCQATFAPLQRHVRD
jgi:hypothetical protein